MPDVYQRVIKRDGKEVAFDPSKIENAIRKSNAEVDPVHQLSDAQIEAVVDMLTEQISEIQHAVNVEDIQDMVEKGIMSVRGYEVAQKYVRYRYKRELARRANTTDQNILSLINLSNEEIKQENSNKNPVINSTQRDYIAGETSKDLTARVLIPKEIWDAHEQGIIHFHDADYFLQSEHNCFHRKERFVTKDGVRSFKDCSDGEKVSVLDKDGVWREATVHKYGKQLMQRVVFTAGRSTKEVICTSNHRWILSDGSVTTNLSVGDSLINLPKAEHDTVASKDIDKAFCLGFVIGDGTDTAKGTKVRLCGAKNRYADTFKRAGWRVNFQKSLNGDAECNISKQIKQRFLDSQGWEHMSYEQKVALFEGYYAADGATMRNGVCTSDERVLNMIRDISALAGYHVSSVKEIIHDTNFKKDAKLFDVKFRKKQNNNNHWIVKSIEPYRKDLEYEAWCVEEPVTHTFTLDGGMVTGNCDLIALDDMLQNGTVISGTLIEKPHSFYTACNVTTQIIAQVASNQYGGQSFSLAHLAPFVQVSRDKIRQEVINEREQCAEKLDRDIIDQIVKIRLAKEITAGIQTIQYQLITLMTCNGQAPFVTMWMYLDEVPEGRIRDDLAMLIEEVLNQRIQGTKNEQGVWVTPAFPKLIYALDEDNIRPGTKYWGLTLLAARCTAKRMVPDYISVKKMKEYKNGDVYPCMGCRSFLTPDTEGLNPDGSHKYYGRLTA